jgi:hypothetical protein
MRRVPGEVGWIEPTVFLAVVLMLTGTASPGQIHDITQPPPIVRSAGEFSARPLRQPPVTQPPPVIDGRAWVAAKIALSSSPGTVPVPTRAFTHADRLRRSRRRFRPVSVAVSARTCRSHAD